MYSFGVIAPRPIQVDRTRRIDAQPIFHAWTCSLLHTSCIYGLFITYITYGLGSFECSTCNAESKRYGRKAPARMFQLDSQWKTTMISDINCLLTILVMMILYWHVLPKFILHFVSPFSSWGHSTSALSSPK